MLLHDQTPSQSIRNEKIHWIRYPGCQNRTIFKDFRLWNLKFALQNLRDFDFSPWNLILSHFPCSYMIKHRLNQSEMKKYIELDTLDVKIGPFSRILGLQTSSLRFKIYAIVTFRFQSLKSLKMVQFWHPGYLIQCIFSFLINWDGVWSCRSTVSDSKLDSKPKSHNRVNFEAQTWGFKA